MRRRLTSFAVALVALGAPAPAAAQDTVTLALDTARAVYGTTVTATGTVAPAAEGATVVVERLDDLGTWVPLATASTDAAGAFSTAFAAKARGAVHARAEASGALSTERPLSVVHKVEVNRPRGRAFLEARLVAYVAPLAHDGRVAVRVKKYGRVVGRVKGDVTNGTLRLRIPTPGSVGSPFDFASRRAATWTPSISSRARARPRGLSQSGLAAPTYVPSSGGSRSCASASPV